jgi:putative membrane protein
MNALKVLALCIALEHLGFMILEMLLWQKEIGLKVFRMNREKAKATAALAMNQGLYNGFLSFALFWAVFTQNSSVQSAFMAYGFLCVSLAGAVGALTVSSRIFWIQAVPALVGLSVLLYSRI